jgi:hypothetical protein
MTPQIETTIVSSENNQSEKNRQNLLLDFPQAFKAKRVLSLENLHQIGDKGTTFSTEKDWPEGTLVFNFDIDSRNPSWGLVCREDLRKHPNSIEIETNRGKIKTQVSVRKSGDNYSVVITDLTKGLTDIYPLEKRDVLGYSFGVAGENISYYEDTQTYQEAKSFLEESLGYYLKRFVIEFDTDSSQPSVNGIQTSGDLRIIMDLE